MRGPFFDVMLRWWKENGHGNGHAADQREQSSSPAGRNGVPRPQVPSEPPWLAQLDRDGVPRSLQYPTTTLGRILDQTADRFGDLPALIYNHKKRWSYRELLARVNRMAGGLSRLGVRPGDRVVLTLPNCPE